MIRKCHMTCAHKNRSLSCWLRQEICLFGNDVCWITTRDPLFDQWNVSYYYLHQWVEIPISHPRAFNEVWFSNHEWTSLGWNPEYMYNLYSAPITYENISWQWKLWRHWLNPLQQHVSVLTLVRSCAVVEKIRCNLSIHRRLGRPLWTFL